MADAIRQRTREDSIQPLVSPPSDEDEEEKSLLPHLIAHKSEATPRNMEAILISGYLCTASTAQLHQQLWERLDTAHNNFACLLLFLFHVMKLQSVLGIECLIKLTAESQLLFSQNLIYIYIYV